MSVDLPQPGAGDTLAWRGRDCIVRGTDPMSLAERRAELEDVNTGERFLVPLSTLSADAPGRD